MVIFLSSLLSLQFPGQIPGKIAGSHMEYVDNNQNFPLDSLDIWTVR